MLRRKNSEMQTQVSNYEELYQILHTRSEADARAIFLRMRTTKDPYELLDTIKAGDLLVDSGFLPTPSRNSPLKTPMARRPEHSNELSALPWTTVAGHEIVQDLVAIFLNEGHPFPLAFIDKDCFLTDMRAGIPSEAKSCSPLLVNAVCAVSCVGACLQFTLL